MLKFVKLYLGKAFSITDVLYIAENRCNLMLVDIEQAIYTGEILERQKDRETGEWKYRIRGFSADDDPIEVIAKLGVTEKVIIITVYAC